LPTKAEQSDVTRGKLLRAARALFAEHGFRDTPTEAVVRDAGVTRGALYHHFRDKTALFQAVYEDIEQDLSEQLLASIVGVTDPVAALTKGAAAFLDACLDPAVQRIVLLEGPTVLGWDLWREIDQAYGLGLVKAALQAAMEAGAIRRTPVEPLAHILLGGLIEGALLLASAKDKDAARREVGEAAETVIEGLRVPPAPRRRR
jgi:AcrR family transcriptional regulator